MRAYTRHQKNPPALSRLDYILVSSNLANNVDDSDIVTGVKSDHSIVICKISTNNPPKGKGFWKLNCHFLRHDADFVSFIKNKISEFKEFRSDTSCSPHVIWDAFKLLAITFNIVAERNELDSLETQLDKTFDQETAGLIVRSRIKSAEHGEKSSRYFCNLEKRSNDKKNIFILKNNLGSTISNQMDIIQELQSFYQSLYFSSSTPDNTNNITQILDKLDIMPHMSDDSKIQLNRPFTKAGILTSLKSLNLNRTPGYDGLLAEFYIVFFNDICDMLLDCFNYSFEKGFMSSTQRTGVITLLPKKDKDPHLIKKHRPISLLNTDYKIIAKVMANRLKGCLHEIIHEDQTGFMKGRNIGCNIRTVIDLIEYCDANNIPGSILLLDIEKAFDSVEHDFLFEVLKAFDLGSNFIQWIKIFYFNRTNYISNNGFLSEGVCLERGIFQGCPISPLLFLCVIEVLAISIRNNKNVCGIKLGDIEKKVKSFS